MRGSHSNWIAKRFFTRKRSDEEKQMQAEARAVGRAAEQAAPVVDTPAPSSAPPPGAATPDTFEYDEGVAQNTYQRRLDMEQKELKKLYDGGATDHTWDVQTRKRKIEHFRSLLG